MSISPNAPDNSTTTAAQPKAVTPTNVSDVSSSAAGAAACSRNSVITADPTPSSASCVHSIIVATTAAATPTSALAKNRAATTQKMKPRPIVSTFAPIRAIEFSNMDRRRGAGAAGDAAVGTAPPSDAASTGGIASGVVGI